MSYPTYYISSSVTCVDTSTESKIIMLPPALDTLEVKPIMILDRTGNASVNNIYLSTQIDNFLDGETNTKVMNVDFQCLSVIPYSTTRYAITTNYTQGLGPFLFSINVNASYTTVPIALEPMYGSAISSNGTVSMVVSLASSNEGIWISTDSGVTYTNSYSITSGTNFADGCMSSAGNIIYVCDRAGNVYVTENTGITWAGRVPQPSGGGTYVLNYIACSSDGTTVAITTNDNFVLYSSINKGATFSVAYDPTIVGPTSVTGITSLAMSGDGQTIYLGLNSMSSTPNILVGTLASDGKGGGTWTFIPGAAAAPTGRIWQEITCSSNGMIAYASVTNIFLDGNYELWKSTDKGQVWTLLTGDVAQIGVPISCDNTGTILYSVSNTLGGMVCFSLDGGTSFQQISPPIPLPGGSSLPTLSCSRNGSFFIATNGFDIYRGLLALT
jgi:hypothetical protein